MARVNVEIPDDKVDGLVDMYKARYGVIDEMTKSSDKLEFLGKMLSHETIQIIRQTIIEQAQIQAQGIIKADASINKTAFEIEAEARSESLGARVQPSPTIDVPADANKAG